MAYSMPDGREIFGIEDYVASFDIDRVSLGGPVFDLQKLENFNGQYLRDMDATELLARLKAWRLNDETWSNILPMAQPRLRTLSDMIPVSSFLFSDRLTYAPELLVSADLDAERLVQVLKMAQWELEKPATWTAEVIQSALMTMAEKEEIKLKKFLAPFFVAVSGSKVSLPLFESMEQLGRDLVLRRLHYAQEALGALDAVLSGKKLKKLEKTYIATYGRA
jgi:glutamyl-tRNA synthetase